MIRKCIKYCTAFFGILIVCCISLIIVYSIPKSVVCRHILDDSEFLSDQGDYPYMGIRDVPHALDNWTEAMVLNSYYMVDSNPLINSVVFRVYQPMEVGGVERLSLLLEDENYNSSEYIIERTSNWMGFSIILRPLLILFSYQNCRNILNIVAYIIFILFVLLARDRFDKTFSYAFSLTMILFHYYVLSLEFTQGIFCVFISIGTVIYITYAKREIDETMLLMVVGQLAAFFDWFSIPFITYGIVMIALFTKKNKEESLTVGLSAIIYLKNSFFWALGYGLMTIAKTIIAYIVVGESAISFVKGRISADTGTQIGIRGFLVGLYDLLRCVLPFSVLSVKVGCVCLFLFLSFEVYVIIRYDKNRVLNIVYAVTGVTPVFWYIVFKGHIKHVGIDYRTMIVSCLAFLMIFGNWIKLMKERYSQ